jgi:hypothetical protein
MSAVLKVVVGSLALLAVCSALVSCAPDKPVAQDRTDLLAQRGGKSAGSSTASDMPVPPTDALYTIYCQVLAGPDHVERSRQLRQALRGGTSLKDWYLIHGADQSTLYYGFYRTINPRDEKDAAEGRRAIHDLNTIRAMVDTNGYRPFSTSVPVPIDSPDPQANPAWDLARTKGYWSVEIAVYKDSPERKQAAVDAVRAAREQGIEAYYYHGPTSSSVCIGCWPREAIRETDAAAQNTDPDRTLLVTPNPMPDQLAQGFQREGMNTVAPRIDIEDPTLADTMRRFPEHAVNGDVHMRQVPDPAGGPPRLEREHSVPVKIAHRDDTQDLIAPPGNDGGAPAAAMRNQEQQQPGMGRLKSIGE